MTVRQKNTLSTASAIVRVPPHGFRSTTSATATAFIRHLTETMGLTNVRSARCGGEVRIGKYKVDAVGVRISTEPPTLVVAQFHGCYWAFHGYCPRKEKSETV